MGESHVLDILTMRGPDFLVLYIVVALVVLKLVDWVIAAAEPSPPTVKGIRDPYLIAYLRGGQRELVRVVSLSLALRGLLRAAPNGLVTSDLTEIDRATVPMEKAILTTCRLPLHIPDIARDGRVELESQECYRTLTELGLYSDARMVVIRGLVVAVAMAVLLGFAFAKISVALSTGHRNTGILIGLAVVVGMLLLGKAAARRTRLGERVLRNLRVLFGSLKKRRDTLSATALPEATLLAAVFGVYITAGTNPNLWRRIFSLSTESSGGGGSGVRQ